MNKRLTPEQDLEHLLEEDGGEFGAIYRRLSRPEPPRRLDRVVLANAARAAHGGRAPRAQRWALAVGSVTGVVLAAGIAWQVGQQMQSRESVPEGSRSSQDSRVVPVEAITESQPRQKAKSDLIMRDADEHAEDGEDALKQLGRMKKQDMPSESPPAAAMASAPPQASVASPAPAPARNPQATMVLEELGKLETQEAPRTAGGQAKPFPEDKDVVLNESSARAERVQETAAKSVSATGRNAAAQGAPAESRAAAASAASVDDSLKQNMRLSPDAWLEEIERLASTGQHQQAVDNLRLFRSQYPDWPLPDALHKLEP